MSKFAENLLSWYDQLGRKLPWRETNDPYRIWVSEIMLQQTRVETVEDRYILFMKRFPTVEMLSKASEEEVLKLWEGLGYYRRARMLYKTSKIIAKEGFPTTMEELKKLPGIGLYTSGAIASIAFKETVPAVDGNVYRVMTRFFGIKGNITYLKTQKQIFSLVQEYISESRPGDFNQALMDLGAMICLPKSQAKCTLCPLKANCMAFRTDEVSIYPIKSAKKEKQRLERTIFLICYGNRLALEKRKDTLLEGLYQFPNVEGKLSRKEAICYLQKEGWNFDRIVLEKSRKHVFTHLEWNMCAYRIDVQAALEGYTWANALEIKEKYAIPTAFKKFFSEGGEKL